MTAPTYAELAVAISYVLQKWKDAGAPEAETAQFDDLLIRAASAPNPEPTIIPAAKLVKADEPFRDADFEPTRRKSQRLPMSEKLRALDREIDAVNREVED